MITLRLWMAALLCGRMKRNKGNFIMKIEEIKVKPIGIIHTSYTETKGMPVQGIFEKEGIGRVELFPEYLDGLKDIDGFSHLILIYCFDREDEEALVRAPLLEDDVHGIFAVRSPKRPNNIGLSIVKLEGLESNGLVFSQVDILDETPLLDIKPYVSYFDARGNVENGWLDKHFINGKVPERTILR